ncbi:bifunctional adenosylcobinamide kinase/adenosylcobinamide-phosphate guanylyltransferase [Pseudonocardia hispaniensis]|uniref:Adenosylcobinamide kinase n=1 Tax=Pseudonocardia hispaniensis TaxID=904933 RepID=A0ABW1J1Y9_9PSEU
MTAPPRRTLLLGGARSGKSRYGEDLLPEHAPVRYCATARRAGDDTEWAARIERHRTRRPAAWTTVEDPDLVAELRGPGPLLIDDIATWLTRVLDDTGAWDLPRVPATVEARVEALVAAVAACPGRVVLVSAEVGLGVVPATKAGRLFRDELGAANTALARVCDEVLLFVAGLPLRLK